VAALLNAFMLDNRSKVIELVKSFDKHMAFFTQFQGILNDKGCIRIRPLKSTGNHLKMKPD
jgi:hypothetical protein